MAAEAISYIACVWMLCRAYVGVFSVVFDVHGACSLGADQEQGYCVVCAKIYLGSAEVHAKNHTHKVRFFVMHDAGDLCFVMFKFH